MEARHPPVRTDGAGGSWRDLNGTPGAPEISTLASQFYAGAYVGDGRENVQDRFYATARVLDSLKLGDFLEVGSGFGQYLRHVAARPGTGLVCGLEVVKSAALASRADGVQVIRADVAASSLPFGDSVFDTVLCAEVIEHMYDTDHLLIEMKRVLRPGGRLVITTPNLASWYNRLSLLLGHQPFFSEVSLRHTVGLPYPMKMNYGHIHVFTLRSLLDLLSINRLAICRVSANPIGRRLFATSKVPVPLRATIALMDWVSKKFPSLASGLIVVASPLSGNR
jgi:SAM-dependent methyltransferase